MKVILTQDVSGLGQKLDMREVSDGYARNYLLPRGLAVIASSGATHQVEKLVEEQDRRKRKEEEKAKELTDRLEGLLVKIPARAGASGRLFGEVTPQRIAEELSTQFGVEVDRRHIKTNRPIRDVGPHSVQMKVAPSLSVKLTVEVTPLAQPRGDEQSPAAGSA